MAISSELEPPQQPALTAEQANALSAAMASGSLREKKKAIPNGQPGATIFKPGYQIGAAGSPSSSLMSPKISPGQRNISGI
ncbi:hypothetical protein ABW20_dc0101728 [Dactylellina cionopaga]|nr:hypothetical protein ABW20_dc0101728 [Dactylellina cionopaga]